MDFCFCEEKALKNLTNSMILCNFAGESNNVSFMTASLGGSVALFARVVEIEFYNFG